MTTRNIARKGRNADLWMLMLLMHVMAIAPVAAQNPADHYTEPQIYGTRPNPNGEHDLGPIGLTGIEARIYPGVLVTVEKTQPNTPADGKFDKGDVIVGVNGVLLKGKNPLVTLGTALTQAEAADGALTRRFAGPRWTASTTTARGSPVRRWEDTHSLRMNSHLPWTKRSRRCSAIPMKRGLLWMGR